MAVSNARAEHILRRLSQSRASANPDDKLTPAGDARYVPASMVKAGQKPIGFSTQTLLRMKLEAAHAEAKLAPAKPSGPAKDLTPVQVCELLGKSTPGIWWSKLSAVEKNTMQREAQAVLKAQAEQAAKTGTTHAA